MARLTSLLAGTCVIVICDIYVASGIPCGTAGINVAEFGSALASEVTGSFRTTPARATTVDRSRKGDRLAPMRRLDTAPPVITNVELGPGTTIQLRSGDGKTLFGVDPAARHTIVAKNVVLPQFTILESRSPAPELASPAVSPDLLNRVPRGAPEITGRKPPAKRPAGCDPSFSPITDPQLDHVFGRCVTDVAGPARFALVR